MELAEVLAEEEVLERRQAAVADVLPPRHPALQRLGPAPHAVAEDHVADAQLDHADRVRDHPRVVLVVRVDHHHHVGPVFEAVLVARLLVAAVAGVLLVDDDRQAHVAGDLHGVVLAAVVHEQDLVDAPGREVGDGGGERGRRRCTPAARR